LYDGWLEAYTRIDGVLRLLLVRRLARGCRLYDGSEDAGCRLACRLYDGSEEACRCFTSFGAKGSQVLAVNTRINGVDARIDERIDGRIDGRIDARIDTRINARIDALLLWLL
jgi:hypothetical protein